MAPKMFTKQKVNIKLKINNKLFLKQQKIIIAIIKRCGIVITNLCRLC